MLDTWYPMGSLSSNLTPHLQVTPLLWSVTSTSVLVEALVVNSTLGSGTSVLR